MTIYLHADQIQKVCHYRTVMRRLQEGRRWGEKLQFGAKGKTMEVIIVNKAGCSRLKKESLN